MEFETLKKDNRQYWILGCVVVILLASIVFFVSTRANYRVTQKVNIANGIINWSPSDLSIIAIKGQNSSGGYDNVSSVPTSGYVLSNSSYCEVNGTKDTSITMEYKDGIVKIAVDRKNTKCYLYFDKLTVKDQILANKTIETRTDFSIALTENTTGKIFSTEDNDGTSYYYAGAVDNNWIKFGGFYWRIIRINGDGTLRIIYNGTTTDQTGETTQIGTAKFSHKEAYYEKDVGSTYINDNAYVGYMYGTPGSNNYEATHANINNSYAKQVVDEWYNTNLNKTRIKEYIDINAGFCGDRSLASGTGVGTTETNYGAYNRLQTNKAPSLKCINSKDLYTVSSSNKGNKALTYPVGLITADEAAYAGGSSGSNNTSYYLYTEQDYWTLSPWIKDGVSAYTTSIHDIGKILIGRVNGLKVSASNGIRPVINLKADVTLSGNGSKASPFEIL